MNHGTVRSWILLALLTALGTDDLAAQDAGPLEWRTDANEAWQAAREAGRPLLLYIRMGGCLYCRKMEHETLADQEMAADIQRQFVAAHIAAEDNPELIRKLHVRTFPATIVISPSLGVVDHIRGYVPPRELKTRLEVAARRSQEAIEPR